MSGLADLEARIEKLEAAAAQVREATVEAHQATKDLRSAIREAKETDLRQWVTLVEATLSVSMYQAIARHVEERVPRLFELVDVYDSGFEARAEELDGLKEELRSEIALSAELHRSAGRLIARLEILANGTAS